MIRNIAKCKKCGDIIESKHRHDYVECSCGAIFVDGGHDYIRRGGDQFDEEFDRENGFRTAAKDPSGILASDNPISTIFGVDIMSMNFLTEEVWNWFDEKGLHDPVMQMVKVQEEVGELAHEISRGRRDTREVVDSLGDALVTIIGMCHHLKVPVEAALSLAYSEIKDRKGKVVEGSFVKDE